MALLAGCGALQQAPLIYSSQVSMGVDVTSTTAANPGVSFNVGYKQTDVAYVPVAVARKDREGHGGSGDIVPIVAEFGQDESGQNQEKVRQERDARLKAFQAKSDQAKAAEQAEIQAKAVGDAAEDVRKRVQAALITLGTVSPAPPAAAASEVAAGVAANNAAQAARTRSLNELDAQVKAVAAATSARYLPVDESTNLAALQQQLQAALTEAAVRAATQQPLIAQARARTQEAQAALAAEGEALKVVESLLVTKKRDAMSVYGTFNGTAQNQAASSPTTGVDLGRVFSTGLASQNLTEAFKARAAVDCVEKAGQLIRSPVAASAAAADVVAMLRDVCGRRSVMP